MPQTHRERHDSFSTCRRVNERKKRSLEQVRSLHSVIGGHGSGTFRCFLRKEWKIDVPMIHKWVRKTWAVHAAWTWTRIFVGGGWPPNVGVYKIEGNWILNPEIRLENNVKEAITFCLFGDRICFQWNIEMRRVKGTSCKSLNQNRNSKFRLESIADELRKCLSFPPAMPVWCCVCFLIIFFTEQELVGLIHKKNVRTITKI